MKKTNYIYKITNLANNKIYIGSTTSENGDRINNHRWCLKNNRHKNSHLQRSWNKHGEDNFIFEVIEYVDKKENVLNREQYYLNTLLEADKYIDGENSIFKSHGFNLCPTAGATYGWKANEEQKRENSKRGLLRWSEDEEYRDKMLRHLKDPELLKIKSEKIKELHRTTDISEKISMRAKERYADHEYKKWWNDNVANDPERIRKASESLKRKYREDGEWREMMLSNFQKNIENNSIMQKELWATDEYRQKQMAIRRSNENRNKQSEGLKKHYANQSPDNHQNARKVGAFDPETDELVKEYGCLKYVGQEYNTSKPAYYIQRYPRIYHGFVWKYLT